MANRKHPLGLIVLSFLLGWLAMSQPAGAQSYNRFQPANGVLVGSTATYVTTAAASSDIRGLWSGTCNASSFLRGDGACAVPAGTGVTSVALTVPSGLSVTGSPVTSTGTLAISTTLSGVVKANGSGFTASAVGLATADVTGTLPVGNGGIGAAALTGIAKGNGTSAFTAAASSDVIGTWSGTCNSSTFLRGDGTCAVAGGGTSPANPSGLIGMSAVNGVAATFDRSDSTHAIDPAIAPTWTGIHSFTNATTGLTVASATPRILFNDAASGTNLKLGDIFFDAGVMSLRSRTDADAALLTWLQFDGSTNQLRAPAGILGTGAGSLRTANNTFIGLGGGAEPQATFTNTVASATNGKTWGIGISNTFVSGNASFSIAPLDDTTGGIAGSTPAVLMTRSGLTTTNVTFPTTGTNSFYVGGTPPGAATAAYTPTAWFVGTNRTIGSYSTVAGSSPFVLWNSDTSGDNGFTAFITDGGSGTVRGSISYNRVGGLVVYATTSDRRLKTAIADAGSASSVIDAIKVRQYEWREPGHDHVRYGFVAQELAEVAPEAVSRGDDGETITKTWGVDSSKLVPVLVKEIQELRKRVAALEATH